MFQIPFIPLKFRVYGDGINKNKKDGDWWTALALLASDNAGTCFAKQ